MNDIKSLPRNRIVVAPSLLAADFNRLGEEIQTAADAGAEVLHLDVMDGHLVPNISFGVPVIKSIRKSSNLVFDTHLMIERPLFYAESFAKAGSDLLTFHVECLDNPDEVISEIRRLGLGVGISLKPGTPAEKIFPYLDKVDLVLVMSVEPGFGGQSFMHDQMPKTAAIKREILRRGLDTILEIDGGLDGRTVVEAASHGAHMIVAGTAVFRHPAGMAAAVAELKAATSALDSAL